MNQLAEREKQYWSIQLESTINTRDKYTELSQSNSPRIKRFL